MSQISNTQNLASSISPTEITDGDVKDSNRHHAKINHVLQGNLQRGSLLMKKTILAIAITSIQTIGVGAIAYFALQSVHKIDQATTRSTHKVSSLNLVTYEDTQMLSLFTNTIANNDRIAIVNGQGDLIRQSQDEQPEHGISRQLQEIISSPILITGLIVLIAVIMIVWLASYTTRQILNASGELSKLGKLEIEPPRDRASQDDLRLIHANIHQLALQLEVLTKEKTIQKTSKTEEKGGNETLQIQLLELINQVESAAGGDLTVRAEVTTGAIGTIADFFNSIIENLRDIVTQVKEAATQVNVSIGTNDAAIRQLAAAALTQSAEISCALDAVDQMTVSMKSVAENAQQAAVVAHNAAKNAIKSGEAMDLTVQNILSLKETVGDTTKKVQRLGDSSQQISRVLSLINQIATQTNLLAINAGIEAARAGEEGQGFAVVAEEIGELAIRSASATQEIEQIIENIQRETSAVVQSMEIGTSQVVETTKMVAEAKENLGEILDVSGQIDALVQSICNATTSQLQTSQEVSQLMQQVASISQRTRDSSGLVSQSLQKAVEISQQLQDAVATFKVL
jgi:twitching motility protein PilJ